MPVIYDYVYIVQMKIHKDILFIFDVLLFFLAKIFLKRCVVIVLL